MDQKSIETEGLARLQRGPSVIEAPLTRQQYAAVRSKIFSDAFAEINEDPLPYVLMTAWRVTRTLAIGYNIIGDDEALMDVLGNQSWLDLDWCKRAVSETIPSKFHDKKSGLVPVGATNNREFFEIFNIMAKRLEVEKGTPQAPYAGRMALNYLGDVDEIHHVYPSRGDIMRFEEELLRSISEKMVAKSHSNTLLYLEETLGLNYWETDSLVKTVHNRLAKYADQDTYIAKGLIVARLESIAQRANEVGDVRAETNAVKSLAVIHGIVNNTGGKGTNEDFIDAVRIVTSLDDDNSHNFPTQHQIKESVS